MLFFLNQSMKTSLIKTSLRSHDSVFINPETVAAKADSVMPSSKLQKDARTTKRKRSSYGLKRIGPKIVLCGTPEIIVSS